MKFVILVLAFFISHFFLLLTLLGQTSFLVKRFLEEAAREAVPQVDRVEEIVWATYAVTTNLMWLNSCLVRSMTAMTLFRLYGVPAILRIGARKTEDGLDLEAHMWIENPDGEVLCDDVSDLASYQELEE